MKLPLEIGRVVSGRIPGAAQHAVMRCRPGILQSSGAMFVTILDLRCIADALHRVRATRLGQRASDEVAARNWARSLGTYPWRGAARSDALQTRDLAKLRRDVRNDPGSAVHR